MPQLPAHSRSSGRGVLLLVRHSGRERELDAIGRHDARRDARDSHALDERLERRLQPRVQVGRVLRLDDQEKNRKDGEEYGSILLAHGVARTT